MFRVVVFCVCLFLTSFISAWSQEFSSRKVFYEFAGEDDGASKPTYLGFGSSIMEEVEDVARYFGLIIGINNYPDPAITSLDHPVRDARNMHKVLIEDYSFKEENMQLLENPDREAIIYALDYLANVVGPEDNLLIFYAGHGWWDENAGNGYWLPSDARKISKADWFRNSTLVDYLKEINSRHTLLITDACFSGSIFKTRKAFDDAPKDIEVLYEYPSRKAMTSGSLVEVPDDSPFTRYLIQRLERNKEKYLSSEKLFTSLRAAVINNSEAVPLFGEIRNVGDQGGDFIFIKK